MSDRSEKESAGDCSFQEILDQLPHNVLYSVSQERCDTPMSDRSEKESAGDCSFQEILDQLPHNVSGQMARNISSPIAFVCLLHLANEKVSSFALTDFCRVTCSCTQQNVQCTFTVRKTCVKHTF